jgi:Rad52/22 family double-strand break repair protein
MKLADLKQRIPFQWRIQSCSRTSAKAQCVAYIDARDAMDLLDKVCGPENWQDKYMQVKNTMVCSVGIKLGEEWVWKTDGGSESDIEKEKGELSDSFKRACVKWGIGRFLYDLETRWVDTNSPKNDQNKFPYPIDKNNKRIYDLTKYINDLGGSTASANPSPAVSDKGYTCTHCSKPATYRNGTGPKGDWEGVQCPCTKGIQFFPKRKFTEAQEKQILSVAPKDEVPPPGIEDLPF